MMSQAPPRSQPPRTSVAQCAPTYTRERPLVRSNSSKTPNVTTATGRRDCACQIRYPVVPRNAAAKNAVVLGNA
jgi:hypothetical protein